MSRAVRRLVVDYQPLWILLDLALFALLIVMDWGWLFSVRTTQVVQWFVPVFSVFTGLLFAAKTPVWIALPVSSAERRRALWWIWIGLPLIRTLLCMALTLPVLGPLHGVHATPLQIGSLLELQLLAVIPLGATFAANGLLRRRFGLGAGVALMVPVFVVAGVLSPVQVDNPALLAFGGVAILVLAAASYAGADRIGTLADGLFGERGAGPSAPAAAKDRRLRGWPAMLPYGLGAVVLATAAAVAINYSLLRMVGPVAPDRAHRVLPSQMLMTVILLSAIGGQAAPYALRALRALPIGATELTAALQGFMLVVIIAPVGVTWAVMRAAGMDTSQVPLFLSAAIPMVALRLPVNFRVGTQAGTFIAMLPLLGLVFLPLAPWAHSVWFTGAMLLATIAFWVWTWWEMAYGRGAYRPPPLGVARWRGGFN